MGLTEVGPAAQLRARAPGAFRDPLLRNGHLLTISSALSSVVGLGFWAIAARLYEPGTVGRNSAAISLMMFIAGTAELNLMSSLVRFLPTAGRSARALVVGVYLTSVSAALVLALGCVLIVGRAAPDLPLLSHGWAMASGFVVATTAWTVFVLQDSALTGLRRTWVVPVENVAFSLAKLVLVVVLAGLLPSAGIFVSWTAALVVSVLPVNAYLFRRAIPAQARDTSVAALPLDASTIVRFASADYGGALCWLAVVNLMPLLIIRVAGARANAYFALAWVVSYALYLVGQNMGTSLVVESAADQSRLAETSRHVIVHTLKVIVPLALALAAIAPALLGVFGVAYRNGGTTVLRLLVLSAIPNVVTATSVSAARAQSRTGRGTAIVGVMCAAVFIVSAALLPVVGIAGIGVAWLTVQSLAAIAFLAFPALWLRGPVVRDGPSGLELCGAAGLAAAAWLHRRGVKVPSVRGRSSCNDGSRWAPGHASLDPDEPWTRATTVRTVSALTVTMVGPQVGPPAAVVKVARSPEAANALRADVRAVEELRRDGRLQGWNAVLPTVLLTKIEGLPVVTVERYVGGVDAAALLRWDAVTAFRGLAAALDVANELHHRTAVRVGSGDNLVERWVAQPLASVRSLYRPSSWQVSALGRVGGELRAGLDGYRGDVVWTHGDYTPGNVRITPDGRDVLGVVDWGGGAPGGLGEFDTHLLLIASRALRERREMGKVVRDLLELGGWPGEERRLLAGVEPPFSHRTLVLMCWLRHIASNLEKAASYRRHAVWRAVNVDAVLRRFSS